MAEDEDEIGLKPSLEEEHVIVADDDAGHEEGDGGRDVHVAAENGHNSAADVGIDDEDDESDSEEEVVKRINRFALDSDSDESD